MKKCTVKRREKQLRDAGYIQSTGVPAGDTERECQVVFNSDLKSPDPERWDKFLQPYEAWLPNSGENINDWDWAVNDRSYSIAYYRLA